MRDRFEETLSVQETPDGPFRTGEPTREARLRRAREESWARVARATAEAVEASRRRDAWWDGACRAVLGVAICAFVGVLALWSKGHREMGAFACPATAFVVASALAVMYRARVGAQARRARARAVRAMGSGDTRASGSFEHVR
jgi:hypothetical protein